MDPTQRKKSAFGVKYNPTISRQAIPVLVKMRVLDTPLIGGLGDCTFCALMDAGAALSVLTDVWGGSRKGKTCSGFCISLVKLEASFSSARFAT